MDVALSVGRPSAAYIIGFFLAAAIGLVSPNNGPQQKDNEGHCPTQPHDGCVVHFTSLIWH
jgi:hypothetical protein